MEPFREICHGHQRVLSPWNKRERELSCGTPANDSRYLLYCIAMFLLDPERGSQNATLVVVVLLVLGFRGLITRKSYDYLTM